MGKKLLKLIILLLVLVALVGCAKTEKLRVLWPPLPDTPRLEWLGIYYSEGDFPKSQREAAMQSMVGDSGFDYFGRPFGIAADGKGLVYVSDADQRVIKIFDFNRRQVSRFGNGRRFQNPLGLAVDSRDNLYVVEGVSAKVLVFSADQRPLFSFGGEDVFKKPVQLTLNETLGRIYVSDGAGHRIAVFDMEGKHLFSFGSQGSGDGEFYSPQGLAIDRDHRLFVADQFNARIQVFDADGTFLYKFGERGDRQWNFEFPKDLAFDSDGNLHVLDMRKAALITYRPDGTLLLYTGGQASIEPVGFSMPVSLWIDQNDQIYVADSLNRRFAHWRYFSDEYLRRHPFDSATIRQQEELLKQKGVQ